MHKEHHGLLYGLLAAAANSVCAVLIKMAADVPNETLVFARFFISLLFILPYAFAGKVHLHPKQFPKHIIRAVTGIGAIYCYFYSVRYLPIVNAVTLSSTAPLFLPFLIYFWLKMIIPKARFLALAIGFLGVVAILRPGGHFGEWATIVGLLGGFFSASAQLGIRQLSRSESTETIMTYYFIISVILAFPPMVYSWEPIASPNLWLYIGLIAVTSFVYQYLIVKSLTHAPATKVTTVTYLGVIFSGLLGWWLFSEVPSFLDIGGILLIVLGGLLALLSKEPPRMRKGYE